ncbi:MAG TPA: M15 family metallopeptidase [Thermoanaerobaculia bacterium]
MLRVVAFIRRFLLLALAATGLSLGCSTARPPVEQGSFHKPDLVELIRLDPTIHLDIRYATASNIVHRPVYRQARAFLQQPAAQALVRVHRALSEKGYGLLVFDGYRPWSVTKIFWDSVRPEQRAFVANPKKGSKHNRGCAVDLSLYDLATGKEVEMPSAYDETSERASPDYAGGTGGQRARRDLLRSAMEKEGFTVEPNEWWHFNYKDWKEYPILDTPFEEVREDSGRIRPRHNRMMAALPRQSLQATSRMMP